MLLLLQNNQQQRATVWGKSTLTLLLMQNQQQSGEEPSPVFPPLGGPGAAQRPHRTPAEARPINVEASGETVSSLHVDALRARLVAPAFELETWTGAVARRARVLAVESGHETALEARPSLVVSAAGEAETDGSGGASVARASAVIGDTDSAADAAATKGGTP